MRSFRFLLTRRWLLFAAAVAVVAAATWWLGSWQFDRLDDRHDRNHVIRANEARDPVPVSDVLRPRGSVAEQDQWRVVSATGEYAVDDTVIVRYRTRDGVPGVNVVVPLVTDDGTALVVDRGWLATEASGAMPDDVPAPPPGPVTITGWVRADATGRGIDVNDGSTRAISSSEIGDTVDYDVYGGFVELRSETPEPAQPLEPVQLPELDGGPHFFYGLQWWFFGLLAIAGFGYLAYDEWRHGPRGARRRRRPGAPASADR